MAMKLLMHSCCAPCSIGCVDSLLTQHGANLQLVLYWYNPNIHPFMEYRSRYESLITYAELENLKLIADDDYGLIAFIKNLESIESYRCKSCYRMRLERTAAVAKHRGFTHFTSSLLISPYQNHQLIIDEAERAAKLYDIGFYYEDFRPFYQESKAKAKSLELYMQKYCGCVFSEAERYKDDKRLQKKMAKTATSPVFKLED